LAPPPLVLTPAPVVARTPGVRADTPVRLFIRTFLPRALAFAPVRA
jgi:hypothetical protein